MVRDEQVPASTLRASEARFETDGSFRIPVVPWFPPRIEPREQRRAAHLAWRWRQADPRLALPDALRPVAVEHLGAGTSLHLDDMAGVPLVQGQSDANLFQFRSRLRAVDGDLVVCAGHPMPDYETYCQEHLGLGRVEWLHPRAPADPLALARAVWEDQACRTRLRAVARTVPRFYLHPHLGCAAVWGLASRLQQRWRTDVRVIGPHPHLSGVLNHKLGFLPLVRDLFGPSSIPETFAVGSHAVLAWRARELATRWAQLVVKVPDSVGGRGNVVIEGREVRGRSLRAVREVLEPRLAHLRWNPPDRLLVSAWLDPIRSTPSVQLWIPPPLDGPPILEGVFEQQVKDGKFLGSRGASLDGARVEAARRGMILALALQELGYVGRCSFDLVIVGRHPGDARPVFVEANARWGGCSLPMTLMTRLFGRWQARPYVTRVVSLRGLQQETFASFTRRLGPDLYDRRTDRGFLVLFGPGRMAVQGSIGMIAMGDTTAEAERRLEDCIARLDRE